MPEEEEVTKPPKGATEALITEDPQVDVLEDVEEDSEPLITRRRKGKMVILDSESTDTAAYAGCCHRPT